MLNYIVRRLLLALLKVMVMSFAVFFIIRLLPGDPIEMLVSKNVYNDMTPEILDQFRRERGLDRPLLVQYVDWLGRVAKGDFGVSIMQNYDIGSELGNRITVTLTLGLTAFAISLILGPLFGIISAMRPGKLVDNIVTLVANIGITAPQ